MRATFDAVIATPEEVVFEGAVEEVVCRVPSGDIAFLANHASFVGVVEVGVATVVLADGEREEVFVDGGVVRVGGNRLFLMARGAEFVRDLEVGALEARRRMLAELVGKVDERLLEPVRAGLELREARLGA